MKISKLYSNKPFHNTSFNYEGEGINVILVEQKSDDSNKTQHGVGKTKFGELLDFMLLKKIDSTFFNRGVVRRKFDDHIFFLEIQLNSGSFLLIKRGVKKNTKIGFIEMDTPLDGFIIDLEFENVLTHRKAINFLNEKLAFDFCIDTRENYRRLVNYNIRTQGDYDPRKATIFQLTKFLKNQDKYWKPLLFSLIGFNGELLKSKYNVEEQIKQLKNKIKDREDDLQFKLEDKDSLVGRIQNLESI